MARPLLASLATLVASGVLSAFLNNTPIVVMLLPMLVGVAVRNKFAPSAILMPMGLATLVGGMATTIGTSTNLLVVAIAQDQGLERFNMFDFALPAVIVAVSEWCFCAGCAQAAARTQAAHVGYRAPGLQRRPAHPRRQCRLRTIVRGMPGADRQRHAS